MTKIKGNIMRKNIKIKLKINNLIINIKKKKIDHLKMKITFKENKKQIKI